MIAGWWFSDFETVSGLFLTCLIDGYGVASKYINRYAALSNIKFRVGRIDPTEALLMVKSRPKGIEANSFMTIERLKQEKLFCPPELRWDEGQTA